MDWFQKNIMRSRVEITLTDGRVFDQAATFPGDKPPYGRDAVIAKLESMADGLLPKSRTDRIVDTVDRLEKLGDVSELARLLVPPKRRAAPRRKR
jgi:hypothetical protein